MKSEVIFIKDRLLNDLLSGIDAAADKMARLGSVISQRTSLTWSVPLAWVILKSPAVRKYLENTLRLTGDEARQLDCSDEERSKIAELLQLAQKGRFHVVEDFVRIDPADDFADLKEITTYLRTGAITVDKQGRTVKAKNAADLLAAYCTVSADTAQEAEFVSKVREMQSLDAQIKTARQNLMNSHREFIQLAKSRQGEASNHLAASYTKTTREICLSDEIRLNSDSAVWRSLITYLKPARGTDDGPRFYNRVGIPGFGWDKVFELSGYRPAATPALRYRYPELYKDVPFRGTAGDRWNGELYEDTPEGMKAFKQALREGQYSADSLLDYRYMFI